jgi:hypothetical protein
VNALIPFAGSGSLPPARRVLVNLNAKIDETQKRLDVLQAGKARLEGELGRAAEAKAELQNLVDDDAKSLVDRLRNGAQWMLSSFGSSRARELAAQLSASRIEASIGERALASIAEEIADLERQVSELKGRRPDAVNAVLVEVADSWRAEALVAIEDLRNSLVILSALDSVVAQPLIAPAASIKAAESIWRHWAADLARDPLASVDELRFDYPNGTEDSGRIPYESLHPAERRIVDQQSVGLKLGAH